MLPIDLDTENEPGVTQKTENPARFLLFLLIKISNLGVDVKAMVVYNHSNQSPK